MIALPKLFFCVLVVVGLCCFEFDDEMLLLIIIIISATTQYEYLLFLFVINYFFFFSLIIFFSFFLYLFYLIRPINDDVVNHVFFAPGEASLLVTYGDGRHKVLPLNQEICRVSSKNRSQN